jgi:hypothetical protein
MIPEPWPETESVFVYANGEWAILPENDMHKACDLIHMEFEKRPDHVWIASNFEDKPTLMALSANVSVPHGVRVMVEATKKRRALHLMRIDMVTSDHTPFTYGYYVKLDFRRKILRSSSMTEYLSGLVHFR